MFPRLHPLATDPRWSRRISPILQTKVSCRLLPLESSHPATQRVWAWNSDCREISINYARMHFVRELVEVTRTGPRAWDRRCRVAYRPQFQPTLQLSVAHESIGKNKRVRDVLDCVAGIPLLLLTEKPDLSRGAGVVDGNLVHWTKVSSEVLHHPVLFSLALGFFRQAINLVYCGFAEEIAGMAPAAYVSEVLATSDIRKALTLAKALRPWIQVPNTVEDTVNGWDVSEEHFPFAWLPPERKAASGWLRFLRLHRAIRNHGLETVFGTFADGWNLLGSHAPYKGPVSFWGTLNAPSEKHRELRQLGKPESKRARCPGRAFVTS